MKKCFSKTRFTLVELLAVMGILALLMGIGIGVYSVAHRKMNDAKCRAMIAKMSTALQNYYSKQGYYIQAVAVTGFYVDKYTNDTSVDDVAGGPVTAWQYTLNNEIAITGSELDKNVPAATLKISRGAWEDPFSRQFWYKCPGTHNPTSYDLWSRGSDPAITEDDITNWTQ
ncbi:MAG: type II secretion system protein GspG [Victivallales bacterium]